MTLEEFKAVSKEAFDAVVLPEFPEAEFGVNSDAFTARWAIHVYPFGRAKLADGSSVDLAHPRFSMVFDPTSVDVPVSLEPNDDIPSSREELKNQVMQAMVRQHDRWRQIDAARTLKELVATLPTCFDCGKLATHDLDSYVTCDEHWHTSDKNEHAVGWAELIRSGKIREERT